MAYPQGSSTAAPQKASKTGIIWSIVIFAVTAIVGIVLIVLGVVAAANAIDDFQTVDAGDTRTVRLSDTGTYEVYAGETTGRESLIGQMDIQITDPDGRDVSFLTGSRVTETFESGDEYYEKAGSFDVGDGSDEHPPGAYEVTVTGPPTTTARIGQVPYVKIGLLIGGGIAIGGIGFVVALVILIVALVRRSRVKKANRMAAGGGGYGPGGYGTPAYGATPPPYGQPGPPPSYGQPGPPPAPGGYPPPAPPSTTPPPPAPPAGGTPPPPPPGPA